MQYRFRTLLIVLAVLPAAIASWYWWGRDFMIWIDPLWDWVGGNYRHL